MKSGEIRGTAVLIARERSFIKAFRFPAIAYFRMNTSPKTHLFVVAVETYQDTAMPPVSYVENDARAFVEAWQDLGVEAEDCTVLLSAQATLATAKSRLKRFLLNVPPKERVIFYYAGQAAWEDGVAFLTLHDTQREDVESTSISLGEILQSLAKKVAGPVLVFLDGHADLTSRSFDEELADFVSASHLVFTSREADERSFASIPLQRGIWSHALVQGLQGAAPVQEGRFITAAGLQTYLQDEVPRLLKAAITGVETQTPRVHGGEPDGFLVADLTPVQEGRRAAKGAAGLIKDSCLIGESRGKVRELSGYIKPSKPLSTHNRWEQNFVETAGAKEVEGLGAELFEKIRKAFPFKRKDIDFQKGGSSASIKTPYFDVNLSLAQDPHAPDQYVLTTEVAAFRKPEIITDPAFLGLFNRHCDTVVMDLGTRLDLEAKIDEIEEVDALAGCLDYDTDCTQFTLRLPGSGVVLHATAERMRFSHVQQGDLTMLITNIQSALTQLAGANVHLAIAGG